MKMMSARALKQVSLFLQTGRVSLVQRCCASSSAGKGTDAEKPTQSAPKSTAEAAKSTPPPPPPPPKVKFDNTKYQAGQMYEYNPMSFYDMEIDMSTDRCPQPSSLRKAS